ncbi:enoyl-CoA hydratase/isomerase family protein [Amycolatopsis rubida]|uniref:Enoyl-CoA hydratase/isomerase family protein n=1 Tax=Amycolatopsis rubida TaxID=112413 RepID=A0ABX0C3P5_9PSEU|nr:MULTISPECIES: enoyl-CoA hydratase/isomerase family protein [Amycolatopsis]MYW96206.1 enoyl-CoA hydratase/isomerase family protein [Amycolatopsis rubida]NEC61197.1 enoyl-CoA hydratase/isomerase family protein [Amycolatopsis rubida]OAP24277.1 putative enoyl-CoA hydratase [Amycolatopsis sp. M39]
MTDVAREIVADRVALLEMRRPPNNFFDEALLTELADTLLGLDEDKDVGAVVLCSQGKHFCAGADLRGMGAAGIRSVYRQAFRLFSGRKPVVAAVQGGAIGGGLGLALSADFRIAAPGARLTANFAKLGFHQGFALSVTLPRAVGPQRASELLYTGRSVSGEEAAEIGMCDGLADDPRAAAVELAGRIAASAPLSVPSIRATLRRSLVAEVSAALDIEADAQAALLGSADFAEGIAASIAKRPPRFVGS